jgi:serine protease Do
MTKVKTQTAPIVQLSDQIADLAEKAVASVVNIDTRTVSLPKGLSDEMLTALLLMPPRVIKKLGIASKLEQVGLGSGVIVGADGYILTNSHVATKGAELTVTLNDERVFKGKVVGRDKKVDLALVKIEADNLPAVELAKSETLRLGQMVMAIGSPGGMVFSVSTGIISALRRKKVMAGLHLLQTDAAISQGSSGGPLFNMHGQLIGVNVAVWTDAQNIGLSIPVDRIKRFLAENL